MQTDVRFPSSGLALAGRIYIPERAAGEPGPAVVIGHQTTAVKEQSAAQYAQRLAELGFIALTFDAAYQGESEGEPHGLEDPFQRAEDFRAAVSYLTTRDEVDPERIGVLGICGSGGYVPFAAQTDHRMKAVAGVSGADVPGFFRDADPQGWRALVARAGQLRSDEAAGKPATLVSAVPDEVDDATPALVRDFHEYYKTPRGYHPRSTNRWVARSADALDQYDSYAEAHKIAPRPLLMIAGSEAATLAHSRRAVANAGETAELHLVDGAGHVDLYDRDEPVAEAVGKLAEFFGRHLAAR
ncbi:alpha/beta hydrolase [Saccharopolyspora sp. HNM0983]|uniref:Alpha/beta hydrolase n=2 Tax=Saccharopolyspora montiporae TaxID=2781240 RepID=A0A929B5U4_9PSEU|nr:alpha/beta hydrolase [Saccharopolyspora sp. HNM0983]